MAAEDTFIDDAASILDGDDVSEDTTDVEEPENNVEDPDDDPLNGNVSITRTTGEEGGEDEEQDPDEAAPEEEVVEEGKEEGAQKEDPDLSKIPHYQEIKAKYPNLFKEFPGLKTGYFFGQDLRNIFGTLDQAKAAVQDLDAYWGFEQEIMSGKSETLLKLLHKEQRHEQFVEDFLPTLRKVDQQSYIKATEPIIVGILQAALNEGQRIGGDNGKNLVNAVKVLSKEIFNSIELPRIEKKTPKEDPEKVQLRNELQQRAQRDEQNFKGEVAQVGENLIKQEILKILPKELTQYQKNTILRLAVEELYEVMMQDRGYLASQQPLWQGAKRANFVGDWKARIVKASLARAKQSLNSVVKKHLVEFTGRRQTKNPQNGNVRRGEGQSTTSKPTGVRPIKSGKEIDSSKTSAMDILNDRNIHFKR